MDRNKLTAVVVVLGAFLVVIFALGANNSARTQMVMITADGKPLSSVFSGRPVVNVPRSLGTNTVAEKNGLVSVAGRFLDKFFGLDTVYAGSPNSCSPSNYTATEFNCSDAFCDGGTYYAPGVGGGGSGGSASGTPCSSCNLQAYCEPTQ
jgi:hypothetical protein